MVKDLEKIAKDKGIKYFLVRWANLFAVSGSDSIEKGILG